MISSMSTGKMSYNMTWDWPTRGRWTWWRLSCPWSRRATRPVIYYIGSCNILYDIMLYDIELCYFYLRKLLIVLFLCWLGQCWCQYTLEQIWYCSVVQSLPLSRTTEKLYFLLSSQLYSAIVHIGILSQPHTERERRNGKYEGNDVLWSGQEPGPPLLTWALCWARLGLICLWRSWPEPGWLGPDVILPGLETGGGRPSGR